MKTEGYKEGAGTVGDKGGARKSAENHGMLTNFTWKVNSIYLILFLPVSGYHLCLSPWHV